jgi:O-antigen ligase
MEKKASLGSYLVGLYLFSVPVFSYSDELGLNKIPQVFGALVAICAIYSLIKVPVVYSNRSMLFYALFAIWSITSFVFARYQSETESLVTLLKVAIISISAAILIRSRSDFFCSITLFFISIFVTLLLNYDNIMYLSQQVEISDEDRFAGTFANANTVAMYCLSIIWAGCTLLLFKKTVAVFRLIILSGIVLAGVFVIYSGSNKGLLGICFFLVVIAWILIRKYGSTNLGKILIGLTVAGGVFYILNVIITSPFFFRVQTMFQGENDSSLTRVFLFMEALKVWSSSLKTLIIGVGMDNFRYYSQLSDYSHSTITEALAGTGLVGFGLYFLSFLTLFFSYIKALANLTSDSKNLIILVLSFLFLVLFFNAAAVMYDDRLFWPLIGVISAYGAIINISGYKDSKIFPGFSPVGTDI